MSSAGQHHPSEGALTRRTWWLAIANVAISAAIALPVMLTFASVARPQVTHGRPSVMKPAAAFDPTARLVSAGHQLRASGPAPVCPKSDKVFLTVTVTQSGVTASGRWSKHDCTGGLQHWHVLLTTVGGQTLKRGKAIGHGGARIIKNGGIVVTRRWSRTVTLL